MTKIISSFSAIAIVLGALLHAGAAAATPTTATRTWVSGAGSDANPCTRALPCATFGYAYSQTSAGGEIDVLDGGEFGPVAIYHAITIANDGAGTAAITPPSNGVIAIYILGGGSDAVVLRGLTLNGINSTAAGIVFQGGASLVIDHCKIEGFQTFPGIGFGPTVAPSKLLVTDTVLSNNGASNNASVLIATQGGGAATAHLERVQIFSAIGNGIRADSTEGPGAIDVELHDVTVDGASGGSGIVAVSPTSGGPAAKLVADNVTASHNAGYGFRAVGGTASIYLSHSVSEDNSIGVGASSGGTVFSYGDNRFANNSSGNGVTPTAIPQE